MNHYKKSRAMLGESKSYLAGGVASSLRSVMSPVPLFGESAHGVRIRDVDGNEYMDYLLAYGPLILGHSHAGLTAKIMETMNKGYTYGLQHQGEIALAKRLTEILTCAEKVSLSGSGTEAVMLAIRLARAYTGRQKVIRFAGHYHGWSDSIYTSFPSSGMEQHEGTNDDGKTVPGTNGQSLNSLEDIVVLPWNDTAALEAALLAYKDDIAAVITEPVMCNSGCILPKPGYLQRMRELTHEHGIVMIMDEVITGFRLALGGAQEVFGVVPDLVTVGKALGGGIAISAVGGKRDIMKLVDDGEVSILGTLNGNCAATTAAITVIDYLSQDEGAVYVNMRQNADTLVSGIRELLGKRRISGVVNHIGPVFHMMFTDRPSVSDFDEFQERDAAKYARFAEIMLEEGVLIRPNGLWYICAAHGPQDIEETLQAVDRSLRRLS